MFLYTSSNIFELLWYHFQYVCRLNCLFLLSGFFIFSDFSFHSIFAGLSFFMVKAYSKGTMICHTTNILNFKFCCCVQWIKPPFLKYFQINVFFMIPFLVRKSFLIEFWIDYIVAPGFLFVNTIFVFFYLLFYNCIILVYFSDYFAIQKIYFFINRTVYRSRIFVRSTCGFV